MVNSFDVRMIRRRHVKVSENHPKRFPLCVGQVRLRKVERMRREGLGVDALLRPRHGPGMTRSSSHASITSSAGSLAYSLEAFETFEAYEPVCSSGLSLSHDT